MINYGFQEPKITKNHYVEGDGRLLGASILNPDGDWTKSLPVFEHQALRFETFGCTVFGLETQVQTLHKYLYGDEPDYDERYNYNLAEIDPPGADPQVTYETARKKGFVSGLLPMTDTIKEYRTPRPVTEPYIEVGKKWKDIYFFDHDWILKPTPEKLRTKLKECPLCVSVTAWYLEDGVYVDKGQKNTHWCLLYKMDDEYYYVFDSYETPFKRLPIKDHKISYAKRIVLYKKDPKVINSLFLKILQGVLKLLYDFKQYTKNGARVVGEIISGVFSKRN